MYFQEHYNEQATQVHVDASNLEPGNYTLILEQFNTLSRVGSALKTDEVRIEVLGAGETLPAPTLDHNDEANRIFEGSESSTTSEPRTSSKVTSDDGIKGEGLT